MFAWKRCGLVLVAGLALLAAPAAEAQSADGVMSRHVREADGTTGQDTNSGAGIKSGHIQDGAITAAKLAEGAVTETKLADGAVTGAAIADGAVTDAKIAGPISGSKIGRAGLDADTLDGLHAGAFSTVMHGHEATDVEGLPEALTSKADLAHGHDESYLRRQPNVVVVSAGGQGDFDDLAAALASIADASEGNPYLVKVMPGVYATAGLELKPFVDVEGSGDGVTRIDATDVVRVPGSVEVRGLTLNLTGVGSYLLFQGGQARMTHATVLRTGERPTGHNFPVVLVVGSTEVLFESVRMDVRFGPTGSTSVAPDMLQVMGKVTLRDCDVRFSSGVTHATGVLMGGGYLAVPGMLVLEGSSIDAVGGWQAFGINTSPNNVVAIRSSRVRAESTANMYGSYGIYASGNLEVERSSIIAAGYRPAAVTLHTGSFRMAASRIEGPVEKTATATGTYACVGLYDGSFAPVSCP